MSLINQMLQELDARRSEVPEAGSYGHQIRAIPEKKGIHTAWWIVLALGVVLAVVLAWAFWHLRQTEATARVPVTQSSPPRENVPLRQVAPPAPQAPIAQAPQSPELPLRLATDLSAPQPVAQQNVVNQQITSVAAPVEPTSATTIAKQDGIVSAAVTDRVESIKTAAAPAPTTASIEKTELVQKKPGANAPARGTPVVSEPAKVNVSSTATIRHADAAPVNKPNYAAQAVAINKQVKELTPQQRAENEYRKATVLLQQGKSGEAIASLEQALAIDSRHAAARQTLVGVLVDGRRIDDAIRVARDGIAVDPAQPGLAMILARLQLEKGELRSSIDTLQHTLPYAADNGDYHAFLAALLQRDARHKEAVEHYLTAVRKAPQNGAWWMGLGISLQAEKRATEAKEAYGRAKSSNTLSPELIEFIDGKLRQLPH